MWPFTKKVKRAPGQAPYGRVTLDTSKKAEEVTEKDDKPTEIETKE